MLQLRSSFVGVLVVMGVIALCVPAVAKPCPPHKVYGLIGQRYAELHGSDGPLGCPITDELDVPEGGGRYNRFERGVIVFSPSTGGHSVQSVYSQQASGGATLVVDWGDTSPFNYDRFLVRWDFNGNNIGQRDVAGPRTHGHFEIPVNRSGMYRIVVEGCDHPRPFSNSVCRQGWSKPMTVPVTVDLVTAGRGGSGSGCPTQTIGSVAPSGSGQGAKFLVQGCGFHANAQLRLRFVTNQLEERDFNPHTDASGRLSFAASSACVSGTPIHVSATDGRTDPRDLTGFAWSNTVATQCP